MAQLAAQDVPRLKLKWAFGFPGANFAFAQPTVMGGRIFIGSQSGKVYSLDANTGCTYWEFDAGPERRFVQLSPLARTRPVGLPILAIVKANVHAMDAATGKALWKVHIDSDPARGSPARQR